MRKAPLCSSRGSLALWGDPTALSPFAIQAVSQNLGTDMLFPLEVVIDEEIRYLPDALLFFCTECTKPHFPSPIVFEQQETRLFRSKLQNFFPARTLSEDSFLPFSLWMICKYGFGCL